MGLEKDSDNLLETVQEPKALGAYLEDLDASEVGGVQESLQAVFAQCHNVLTMPALQKLIWRACCNCQLQAQHTVDPANGNRAGHSPTLSNAGNSLLSERCL